MDRAASRDNRDARGGHADHTLDDHGGLLRNVPDDRTVGGPPNIKLQVLNGVLTGSLAGEWSVKLKANPGYNTLPPNNATARVASSEIYVVTHGYGREADALALTVGLPVTKVVNPTTPLPATAPVPAVDRTTANLILIIGPDLAATA